MIIQYNYANSKLNKKQRNFNLVKFVLRELDDLFIS